MSAGRTAAPGSPSRYTGGPREVLLVSSGGSLLFRRWPGTAGCCRRWSGTRGLVHQPVDGGGGQGLGHQLVESRVRELPVHGWPGAGRPPMPWRAWPPARERTSAGLRSLPRGARQHRSGRPERLLLQPGRPAQPGGQDHQEAAPAATNPAACDAYCWTRRTPTRSMPGRGSRHWRSLTSGWHCNSSSGTRSRGGRRRQLMSNSLPSGSFIPTA